MYPVSPEDCLILQAIHSSDSLREAARKLQSDPSGLLRKVQRISAETGFLQKSEGKWRLTSDALLLVGWVEESIASQKRLLAQESKIRISSTLWMAEQFVIPNAKELLKKIPGTHSLEISGTDTDFEKSLLSGGCDLVVVCHPPNDPLIAHKSVAPEKWVAIVPADWVKKEKLKRASELTNRTFVRHKDLNPDLLLPNGALLTSSNQVIMDSLIGVRAAVANGLGWSFVPEISVCDYLALGKLLSVDHTFEMKRSLNVWWLRHVKKSKELAPIACSWAKRICDSL